VGDTVTFTIYVENTGDVDLVNVTVSDPLVPGCDNTYALLAAGASDTYTCSLVASADMTNVATVTGTPPVGPDVTDTDPSSVDVIHPSIDIRKNTEGADSQQALVGDTVTFTIYVENTGDVDLVNVAVSDPLAPGCDNTIGSLLAGASTTYTCTVVASADFTNVATVTGDDPLGNGITDTDPSSVDVIHPAIDIRKNAEGFDTQNIYYGDDVTFTIRVTNTGDVPLLNVVVTDTLAPVCESVSPGLGTILPGDFVEYTCTVTNITAGFTNVAAAAGDDPLGNNITDSDPSEVTITELADLSLTKVVDDSTPLVGSNVVFTIVVTNSGPNDATSVSVRDLLPSGFTFVSAVPAAAYNSGTGVWTIGFLSATPGSNTATLTITASVNVSGDYHNIAEVISSDQDDPDSDVDNNDPTEDDQDDVIVTPTQNDPRNLTKAITGTNQGFTDNNNVAVGEIVTYQVTVIIPTGQFNQVRLTDSMDRGLAFVSCSGITGTGLITSGGTLADVCTNAVGVIYLPGSLDPRDEGRQVVFDFGTLTNPTASDVTLTVTYSAVVLNSLGNTNGMDLGNLVSLTWGQGENIGPVSAPDVNIVEPRLSVTKTANPTLVTIGTEVTFTLTLTHDNLFSTTDAFNVELVDQLPVELGNITALNCTTGVQDPSTCTYSLATHTIRAVWPIFARLGGNSVISFRATVLSLPASNTITNTVTGEWTSLPDDISEPQSEFNDLSDERTFPPGIDVDNYIDTDAVVLQFASQPGTGFAPGVITPLIGLEKTKYSDLGDLAIEIPILGVNLPVVGVPLADRTWDLTWLWSNAGWLEETAFPTWSGNSVITAHVYLSNGKPGPFLNLGNLVWGDQIIVHANGLRYIYQVRSVQAVKPTDMTAFKHEDKAWLTLITCKSYDEKSDSYKERIVVRAILVNITEE
jgi:large repetitive protein